MGAFAGSSEDLDVVPETDEDDDLPGSTPATPPATPAPVAPRAPFPVPLVPTLLSPTPTLPPLSSNAPSSASAIPLLPISIAIQKKRQSLALKQQSAAVVKPKPRAPAKPPAAAKTPKIRVTRKKATRSDPPPQDTTDDEEAAPSPPPPPKKKKQLKEISLDDADMDVGTSRLTRRMQRVQQGGSFLTDDEEELERESEDDQV